MSIRARMLPLLEEKGLRQLKPYSCGAASIRFILKLMGLNTTEAHIREAARTTYKEGTSPTKIRDALDHFGVKSKIYTRLNTSDIKRLIRSGNYLILDVDLWQGKHWVVAHKIDGDEVVIMDPAQAKDLSVDKDIMGGLRWSSSKNMYRGGIVIPKNQKPKDSCD